MLQFYAPPTPGRNRGSGFWVGALRFLGGGNNIVLSFDFAHANAPTGLVLGEYATSRGLCVLDFNGVRLRWLLVGGVQLKFSAWDFYTSFGALTEHQKSSNQDNGK